MSAREARDLPEALAAARAQLAPCGVPFLLIQLDRLSAWATSFNIAHDPRALAPAYAMLAEFPAELVESAFNTTMNSHRDTFRLPMPAGVADRLHDDLDERRRVLWGLERMEFAVSKGKIDGPAGATRRGGPVYEQFERDWEAQKIRMAEAEKAERARIRRTTVLKPSLVRNPVTEAYADKARAALIKAGPPAPPAEVSREGWAPPIPPAVPAAGSVDL